MFTAVSRLDKVVGGLKALQNSISVDSNCLRASWRRQSGRAGCYELGYGSAAGTGQASTANAVEEGYGSAPL